MTSPISANSLIRALHEERTMQQARPTLLTRMSVRHAARRVAARDRRTVLAAAEEARLAVELRPHARVGRFSV